MGQYRSHGDPGGFRNVLPPGQDGSFTLVEVLRGLAGGGLPEGATDQIGMYDQLVRAAPGLTEADVDRLFKDASFGVPPTDIASVYRPHPDVTVVRDRSFGVPHIFGQTRYATMFAQGYTAAEDRLFLMDVLRNVGRARLSEFVGGSEANQAMDRSQLAVAPYTEADLTAQIDALRRLGPTGRRVVSADSHAANSTLLSGELVVEGAVVPPGDGGVGDVG
ncbi:MAG: penicillin acylase family protein [Acidimicrobiales bacterium]